MNHGSLFSGIGGFDYAAKAMGWNNVFHCEINPFFIKCTNIAISDSLLFIVPIPGKKEDFISLMKILNVI